MKIAILSGVDFNYGGGGNRPNHLYRELKKRKHAVQYYKLSQSEELFNQTWDIVILEYPFAPVVQRLENLCANTIIYDILDDWGAMGGRLYDKMAEDALIDSADVVIAVSKRLCEMYPKAKYVPNAVEFARHERITEQALPNEGKIRIGYVGNLTGHWIDWKLLNEISYKLPKHELHLVGRPPSNTNLRHNVKLHGEVKYEDIPKWINSFDVCIIPFKPCSLIDSTSPLKLFEYAAAGKPIVSMKSAEHYDCPMLETNDHALFIEYIKNIDKFKHLKPVDIIEFAKNNTWADRIDTIMELI